MILRDTLRKVQRFKMKFNFDKKECIRKFSEVSELSFVYSNLLLISFEKSNEAEI